MNTDANPVDVPGVESRHDEERYLADRDTTRSASAKTSYLQSEAPCSCPDCFPIWD